MTFVIEGEQDVSVDDNKNKPVPQPAAPGTEDQQEAQQQTVVDDVNGKDGEPPKTDDKSAKDNDRKGKDDHRSREGSRHRTGQSKDRSRDHKSRDRRSRDRSRHSSRNRRATSKTSRTSGHHRDREVLSFQQIKVIILNDYYL